MMVSQVNITFNIAWISFQLISQFIMYYRAKEIFESFQYKNIALKYEYQFKAFDMVLNLLIFAHFIVSYH
jgi:hypothetical protein